MDGLMEFFGTTQGSFVLAGVCALVGWLLFAGDSRVEERRRRAIEVSQKLSSLGFQKLPKIFSAYAIGDYSGTLTGIHELHDILADPATREAELRRVFQLLLEEKLKDPEKLKLLAKLVDTAKAAFESGNPLAAAGEIAAQGMDVLKSGTIGGRLLTMTDSPLVPKIDRLEELLQRVMERVGDKTPATKTPAI